MSKSLIICWFSCGAASAVATHLTLQLHRGSHGIKVIRMAVAEEHPDNGRFASECEKWFDMPIETLPTRSAEDIWRKRRYMSGVAGAPCTTEIKIRERLRINKMLAPAMQVFGFTVEERRRMLRLKEKADVELLNPLIDCGYTKNDCLARIRDAGIELPVMYRLGFENNNCIGCVKANGIKYWQRVQREFPEVFQARALLSREIGCRLLKSRGERFFLDQLDEFVLKEAI